jgi:hypothetical protein
MSHNIIMEHYKIQSILFNKDNFTKDQAIDWIKRNGYKNKKIDEKPNTYRFRQLTPRYVKNQGYTKFITKKLNSGIDLIIAYNDQKVGGELSSDDLQKILSNSYEKDKHDIDDYQLDRELSNNLSQVYHNPKTNKSVIAHTGSNNLSDWGSNLKYALGFTPEFEKRKKIQEQAYNKYGDKLITVGHSRGALASEKLARPNSEIYTLDKPSNLVDLFRGTSNPNQVDVRHKNDIVSYLSRYQPRKGKLVTIDDNTNDVIKAHTVGQLSKLNNMILGRGISNNVYSLNPRTHILTIG